MNTNSDKVGFDHKLKYFLKYAEMMPGVIIIHQLKPFTPCFMTSNGLELLGITSVALKDIGVDYHKRFFNNEDMEDYLLKFNQLIERNDTDETFTFFQQVKLKESQEWLWHLASTRIFYRDNNGIPSHVITVALPVNQMRHIPNKAERILKESEFYKKNLENFFGLGKREKEILKLVAQGKSSPEIAEECFISVGTVNTHRKVIKQKLNIKNNYEFTEYAQAFDLI